MSNRHCVQKTIMNRSVFFSKIRKLKKKTWNRHLVPKKITHTSRKNSKSVTCKTIPDKNEFSNISEKNYVSIKTHILGESLSNITLVLFFSCMLYAENRKNLHRVIGPYRHL